MKFSVATILGVASLVVASPVADGKPPIHCNCIIEGSDGESIPCDCNTRAPILTNRGHIHCNCIIEGSNGESRPCDCNTPGSFPHN